MSRPISFDRVASVYDATRGVPADIAEQVVDRLASRIGSGRALEIGVGTGRWARPLQRLGIRVVGVDVGARMLAVGRAMGLNDAIRGDATLLPFRDRSFDSAMSNHLLHLVAQWPRLLVEVARVTRGRYRSVLELSSERPDLSEEYAARAAAHGWTVHAPGLPERELRRRLEPDTVVEVAEREWTRPAEEQLGPIERRAYRDTWDVPEPIHARILEELRVQHGHVDVHVALSVEIAEWDVGRLAAFARASSAGSVPR